MSLDALAERCSELFAKCYGAPPQLLVAAPGRVNLIGEHTDYNEGFVLPMALDRYTVLAASRTPGRDVCVISETNGETARFSLKPPPTPGQPAWGNYLRGVVAGYLKLGRKIPGFDAVIDSSVPYGGGCASSAALEVATATLMEALRGPALEPVQRALLCQAAEHEFAGVPCGIMDQFAAVLGKEGHALLLDCRTRETRLVPMLDQDVTVLIINTGVRHELANSEYSKRRAQCEAAAKLLGVPALRDATLQDLETAKAALGPEVYRRARHVVSENQRTLNAADAIQAANWAEVGRLMYASHQSLRDDYQVSCTELDVLVEIARSFGEREGVIGCRMTGGGFGGCAVSLVRTDRVKVLTKKFEQAYEAKTRQNAAIFSSRPGGGARVLSATRPRPA